MKLKSAIVSIALSLTGALALAGPVLTNQTVKLVADQDGGLSAGISMTHKLAGLFTDTYVLSGVQSWSLVDGILRTAGSNKQDIDFYSASINGVSFDFQKSNRGANIDFDELGMFSESLLNGPLVLTISGRAGEGWADGTKISATYSGTVNVNAAVPEPGSLALLSTGLLALAWVGRRRSAGRATGQ